MTDGVDLFKEINNAVLDLQNAEYQTYHQPLKKLGRLLRHKDLEAINDKLTEGLDLDTWLEGQGPREGMVGSDRLQWPDDPREVLGLTLLLILKCADNTDWIAGFGHQYFHTGRKIIGSVQGVVSQVIIPFVRDYKSYVQSGEQTQPVLRREYSNRIFVVHGHDEGAREATARFLEKLGFEAVVLHEQANRGKTIVEKIEANADVGFAVILLTPDDEGCAKGQALEPRARQNVLIELGYFMGSLGRDRLCILKKGAVEIPSDFAGVVWETMDTGSGWKQSLAKELKAAGYPIDWNIVMS